MQSQSGSAVGGRYRLGWKLSHGTRNSWDGLDSLEELRPGSREHQRWGNCAAISQTRGMSARAGRYETRHGREGRIWINNGSKRAEADPQDTSEFCHGGGVELPRLSQANWHGGVHESDSGAGGGPDPKANKIVNTSTLAVLAVSALPTMMKAPKIQGSVNMGQPVTALFRARDPSIPHPE
ncbi:hypothetical protein BGZ61DRAFT_472140 [Ilyonectria robusta]|uniref:uncharacterized protein n=1 Tax=Ilyonectria robusta TaxID=1079257 RepID=UPI001E8EAD55|nr:uncharacterized protein BGZ61DRAFT_472140 [Ilyonectria robusta]KAH8735738.1 hypothetical protein BGZ61DRAFT_472140 [Ilyonectria robusta]